MKYVDGCIMAVPNANKEKFIEFSKMTDKVFKENGALSVADCWEENVPEGKLTSFSMAVKREEGESIVYSWIVWPSKTIRDAGWEKVRQDSRMQGMDKLLDGKRVIFGSFDLLNS